MEWVQIYDPLGNAWLSTLAAALPILLLLGTLAILEWKAHWAALAGLSSALLVSVVIYGMPAPDRRGDGGLRRRIRALPHRLDHPQRGLSLQPDRRHRAVRDRQAVGRPPVRRSARAGAAHRLLVRRVHRGRRRLRHAGRDHGGASRWASGFTPLYAAGLSLIANTAPGGVWRHRHADPDARRRHRASRPIC